MEDLKIGDPVVIVELKHGGNKRKMHETRRKGRVEEDHEKFIVVNNGKYRECIWINQDESSRIFVQKEAV